MTAERDYLRAVLAFLREATGPLTSRLALQRSLDAFMRYYNEDRPHAGYSNRRVSYSPPNFGAVDELWSPSHLGMAGVSRATPPDTSTGSVRITGPFAMLVNRTSGRKVAESCRTTNLADATLAPGGPCEALRLSDGPRTTSHYRFCR